MASPNMYRPTERHENSTSPTTNDASATPNRRVLRDVSPNVRKTLPAAAMLTRKPLMGSPLKRSFNATFESGEGLTYLKRRKLSDDELLSETSSQNKGAQSWAYGLDGTTTFRAFLQPDDDTTQSIVVPAAEASPTEPNTPSEEGDAEHSSAERKSFSSLINYDPSSQQQASSNNLLQSDMSQAEMLKLRLRIAMYKVRTNQTAVPFAKLRLETKDPSSSVQSRSEAVEEAVAVLRREAQQASLRRQQKDGSSSSSSSIPKLLPGPTLRPTAYSSRMIYEPASVNSSPPSGASPNRLPVAPPSRMSSTPQRRERVRLSYGTPGTAERFHEPAEQELTSSVVKGRVAEGLLGLRNAV